jgi:hypothetical protein
MFTAAEFDRMGLPKTRVPCPAGSLILFDAALPHGTLPNRSRRPRCVQFLRYLPEAAVENRRHARAAAVARACRMVRFPIDTPLRRQLLLGS